MSVSVNEVLLIGSLGQDPEVNQGQNGTVVRLSVATSRQWKDKAGQLQERTTWHRVVLFGSIAESVARYYRKGHLVYVKGELQTSKYTDKDGNERYTTEVVVSGFESKIRILNDRGNKSDAQGAGGMAPHVPEPSQPVVKVPPQGAPVPDDGSDIPF